MISVKAAILNLLSVGAAYGVVVAVFQWGWGSQYIGIDQDLPIPAFVPMLMFAIVFGLSMDYEVFLLSRVREAWHQTGDAHRAVAIGIGSTARVITTAAAIMVVVFTSFVLDTDPTIKMLAVGMAVAVLIDASVVRMVLVPALMSILGAHAWYLPRWLDRIIPDLQLEGPIEPVAPRPSPSRSPWRRPAPSGRDPAGPRSLAALVAPLALLLAGCTGSDDGPRGRPGRRAAAAPGSTLPARPPRPPREATLDQVNKLGASVDLRDWQAGDIGASGRLSDGRLVWLFGDTVRRTELEPADRRQLDARLVRAVHRAAPGRRRTGPSSPTSYANMVRWPMSVAVGRHGGHDMSWCSAPASDRGSRAPSASPSSAPAPRSSR